MCGHGSGNGTPCAGRAICASFDPLGVYIYAVGVESCATRLPLLRSVPLSDPNRGRAWHLWSSSARCSGSRPPSHSLRRRSRRLRGDTRRNASSVDTPPRLATCLTAHPTNRVVACRSVRHSTPRPLPHLPQGAFFFVVSALADVTSARLILPVADMSRFRPRHNLISLCLILAWQFRYNVPNAVENEESERKHQNGR